MKISVNTRDVYKKIAFLESQIADITRTCQADTNNVMSALETMNGVTNTNLKNITEYNQITMNKICGTLQTTVEFLKNSTREFEKRDQDLAQQITMNR